MFSQTHVSVHEGGVGMLDPGGVSLVLGGYARGGDKYTVEAGIQVRQEMGIPGAGTGGVYWGWVYQVSSISILPITTYI